jgi:hypothetical protein
VGVADFGILCRIIALIFVMIAYNLMSIFRMFVLQEKTQKRLQWFDDLWNYPIERHTFSNA